LIKDEDEFGIKQFFEIKSNFTKDKSPEGEYEAKRLSEARLSLFLDMPFFGWILGYLEIYPITDDNIPTYAADTRRIYINTEFIQTKTKKQLKGILMHLVTHLILKHGHRQLSKNRNIWAISTEVNTRLVVKEAKVSNANWEIDDTESIPNHLQIQTSDDMYDKLYKYAKSLIGIEKSKPQKTKEQSDNEIEEFSREIIDEVQEYSGVDYVCGFNEVMEGYLSELGDNFSKLDQDRFKGIMETAYANSRNTGNIPGIIREIIEELLDPKIPWHQLLEQYIQKTIMSDYNWVPPNRKHLSMDIIFPSTKKEFLEIFIAIDTSGSISTDELREFLSETFSIVTSYVSVKVFIIECDMVIQRITIIDEGGDIGNALNDLKAMHGRGGTSFIPPFNWIEDENHLPQILIYFTDGYGPFPEPPNYHVLWVLTTDVEVPFGERIQYYPKSSN